MGKQLFLIAFDKQQLVSLLFTDIADGIYGVHHRVRAYLGQHQLELKAGARQVFHSVTPLCPITWRIVNQQRYDMLDDLFSMTAIHCFPIKGSNVRTGGSTEQFLPCNKRMDKTIDSSLLKDARHGCWIGYTKACSS
jgi:hypothetical protein